MKNEIIFKKNNVLKSDLLLDHVFLSFEGVPILFTCRDDESHIFLCHCSEMRECFIWTISRTTPTTVADLVDGSISIYDAIKKSEAIIFTQMSINGVYNYKNVLFDEIDELDLPEQNMMLQFFDFASAKRYVSTLTYLSSMTYTANMSVKSGLPKCKINLAYKVSFGVNLVERKNDYCKPLDYLNTNTFDFFPVSCLHC